MTDYRNTLSATALIFFCAFRLHAAPALSVIDLDENFRSMHVEHPPALVSDSTLTAYEALRAPMHFPRSGQIPLRADQALWQRILVRSTAAKPIAITIRYEIPWTDHAAFFAFDEKNLLVQQTLAGDAEPGHREFRVPQIGLTLNPGETRMLLLKVSTALHTPPGLNIYSETAHRAEVFRELIIYGGFAGVLVILLIFHLNLYLATRDEMLRKYLLYLAAVGIFIPVRSGLIPQKLMGDYACLSNEIWVILVSLSYFTGISFARSFLLLRENLPKIDKILGLAQYATFLPALALVAGKSQAMLFENLAGLIVGPPLLLLGIYHSLFRQRSSSYFVIGYSLPIAAAIIDNLVENGIIQSFSGRNEMLPVAIAAEFLLFALVIYRKLSDLALSRARDQKNLRRFQAELSYARMIQRQLLPELSHGFSGCDIQAYYQPLHEVGGDYFDVVEIDEKMLGILLTSGTGSGLAAALDASAVRMAFRNSYGQATHTDVAMRQMYKLMGARLQARTVLATYLMFDRQSGKGEFCSAGNPPLLIVRRGGELETLRSESSAQGVVGVDGSLRAQDFALRQGDALVLFSAGLMPNSRKALHDRSARYLLKRINARLNQQKTSPYPAASGERRRRGDVTIILLRFQGSQAA